MTSATRSVFPVPLNVPATRRPPSRWASSAARYRLATTRTRSTGSTGRASVSTEPTMVSAMVSIRACFVLTCQLTELRWTSSVRATPRRESRSRPSRSSVVNAAAMTSSRVKRMGCLRLLESRAERRLGYLVPSLPFGDPGRVLVLDHRERARPEEDPQWRFLGVDDRQDGGAGGAGVAPLAGRASHGGAEVVVDRQPLGVHGRRSGPIGGVPGRLDERDLDAEALHLGRQAVGETLQPELGRVVEAEAGQGEHPGDGRHLDDVAAALRPHVRQGSLRDPQRTEQVDVDLVAGLLLAHLLDHAEQAVAGVVHHDVEPAEVIDRLLNDGDDGRPIGDLELQGQDGVAVLGDQVVERRGRTAQGGDTVTALECGLRPFAAEALGRTGDEPNL